MYPENVTFFFWYTNMFGPKEMSKNSFVKLIFEVGFSKDLPENSILKEQWNI